VRCHWYVDSFQVKCSGRCSRACVAVCDGNGTATTSCLSAFTCKLVQIEGVALKAPRLTPHALTCRITWTKWWCTRTSCGAEDGIEKGTQVRGWGSIHTCCQHPVCPQPPSPISTQVLRCALSLAGPAPSDGHVLSANKLFLEWLYERYPYIHPIIVPAGCTSVAQVGYHAMHLKHSPCTHV